MYLQENIILDDFVYLDNINYVPNKDSITICRSKMTSKLHN